MIAGDNRGLRVALSATKHYHILTDYGTPSEAGLKHVVKITGWWTTDRRRFQMGQHGARGIAGHQSARSMARLLGRSPSTVSRELGRNGGYDRHRAALAVFQLGQAIRLRPLCR